MENKQFPYKTLIWALVALVALFLFKTQIAGLLEDSEEVNVFGIGIKVSKDESDKLLLAQNEFRDKEEELNQKIEQQEVVMDSLNALAKNLAGEIQGCQAAQSTAVKLNSNIRMLENLNGTIKREQVELKDYQIIQRKSSLN
ncbi:hypothetical protein [Croceivirga thetidis]|uniref:Uncharacterized protein n=1 Tax=Croceivirga thetidis TaxID=2721623 RepID=A0ABX1GVT7_9FLAO|nr:hypothetical protein [Croceivirga thetidis]NKI33146.1 hypothetical protein [Croceivirga thetidis]